MAVKDFDTIRRFPQHANIRAVIGPGAPQPRIQLFAIAVALVIGWACFSPALSGGFHLDDEPNLSGLSNVYSLASGIDFSLAGVAGPTGRPLALATFAMQANDWDSNAAAFLIVNILLHLCNALLLGWCLLQVGILRGINKNSAALMAASAAAVWMVLPLLSTATLLIVQRMTTLSAFFMLLGLGGYLAARRRLDKQPRRSLVGMTASLVAGTILATFSKESGALLPVYVLALEATVLARPIHLSGRLWLAWRGVFLVVPLLAIFVYLAAQLDTPEATRLFRGFDAYERALTQTKILWVYLFKAVAGLPHYLGIYQDPFPVSRNILEPLTFLAGIAWLASLLLAVFWRRRFPLFALAVFWYLGGHLIESTTLTLELYFEHRNYMPMIGPVYAVVCGLLSLRGKLQPIGLTAVVLLFLGNAWLLHGFTTLWGDPSASARYWTEHHPHSLRGITNRAEHEFREEGPFKALQLIREYADQHPEKGFLRIRNLTLRCMINPEGPHNQTLDKFRSEIPGLEFNSAVKRMLSELFGLISRTGCGDIDYDLLIEIADEVRSNPRYAAQTRFNQFYFRLLAEIADRQGRYDASIDHLQSSISYLPSPELNYLMVSYMVKAEEIDRALEFIQQARQRAPKKLLDRLRWQRSLDNLEIYIQTRSDS